MPKIALVSFEIGFKSCAYFVEWEMLKSDPRPLKFENMWMHQLGFKDLVGGWWS